MNPLDAILKPKSIAVVGASRREGSIGREILHQLVEFDFHGKLFPVNPKADFIHSMKAFPLFQRFLTRWTWPLSWCRAKRCWASWMIAGRRA